MEYPDTSQAPTFVSFLGITYRLMGGARRYYLSQSTSNAGRKKAKGLHVAIYEHATGAVVRRGQVCHHIDGNPFNNAPDNLAALTRAAHQKHHLGECSEEQRQHLARVRPLAAAWHSTPAGKALHRSNGHAVWANREAAEVACQQCGKAVRTRQPAQRKYCGGYCNFKALRDSGRYNKQLSCCVCGAAFTGKPSASMIWPQTCSPSCRTRWGVAKRKQTQS